MKGMLEENSVGIGTATRGMVRRRAAELAAIDGRTPMETSVTDWDTAKRELSGEPEVDPREAILESAPESERWDPVPGSVGTQAPEATSEDEDAEARSNSERLVAEGVAEADHDQMLQAVKKAASEGH